MVRVVAYVTGHTSSSDFPMQDAFQTTRNGSEVFITKFSSSGNTLDYSSYLGGDSSDVGLGVAVDDSGNTYITGYTN